MDAARVGQRPCFATISAATPTACGRRHRRSLDPLVVGARPLAVAHDRDRVGRAVGLDARFLGDVQRERSRIWFGTDDTALRARGQQQADAMGRHGSTRPAPRRSSARGRSWSSRPLCRAEELMLMAWSASVGSTLQVLLTVRSSPSWSGKSGLIESVAGHYRDRCPRSFRGDHCDVPRVGAASARREPLAIRPLLCLFHGRVRGLSGQFSLRSRQWLAPIHVTPSPPRQGGRPTSEEEAGSARYG